MGVHSNGWRIAVLTVLASAIVSPARPQTPTSNLVVQQFNEENSVREQGQRATDMLKALAVSAGDWVADVGAGNGYYAQRLSQIVGPAGKVFAEDISDRTMNLLEQRVKLFDLRNVEVVKGDDDNPKLPASSLSAVLVVDSYHHFSQPQPMLEQVLRALKPGGRLVIADYSLSDRRSLPRAEQVKMHEIDPALVRAELQQIGFHVAACEDPFVKRTPELKNSSTYRSDLWLMTAVRPKA
jgi:ubiquinone/menaquinone biosynthesis C-methylase UbiE